MQQVYNKALEALGTRELAGAVHNPEVVKMFFDVGHGWVQDDETPWCAAFVGSVLSKCGIKHTGKLNARSYLEWGEAVAREDVQKGDVVVFWRNGPKSAYGHVAFFDHFSDDGSKCYVLGGNQGNEVSIAAYDASRILGFRRAVLPRPSLEGSRTIKAVKAQRKANQIKSVTSIGAIIAGGANATLGNPETAADAVEATATIQTLLPWAPAALGAVILALVVWNNMKADEIEEAREDDHRRGLR